MTLTPRRIALVGVIFVVIGAIYYTAATILDPTHVDWAGFVMLLALGVAMSLMAYVLFTASQGS
jgi:hypothetical protein